MLGSGQFAKLLRMKWVSLVLGLCALALAPFSVAESATAGREKAAIVDALEIALTKLPDDKRQAAQTAINTFKAAEIYSDYNYGWERAEPILAKGGVSLLVREADRQGGSLRYAKVDALLAAGFHSRDTDPEDASRLNAALLSMAERGDDFEQPVYAHAAAELAALRCDRKAFGAALSLLPNPQSLRYRFWGARISGEVGPVIADIGALTEIEDTRPIRQAIDGYRLIHDFGYCSAAASPMAD